MRPVHDVAVVGAAGADGAALLAALAERGFPVGELFAVDRGNAVGTLIECAGRAVRVEDLAEFDFSQVQLVFFLTSAADARRHVPRAVAACCWVIDHSPAFRYVDEIPLVIAAINPHALAGCANRSVVATPSPATFRILAALEPLREAGIDRVIVSQPDDQDAGAGGLPSVLEGAPVPGYSVAEVAMRLETQKVLGDRGIGVNPAVRPWVTGGVNTVELHLQTKEKVSHAQACELLRNAPALAVIEDSGASDLVAQNQNEERDRFTIVRIREDLSCVNGLDLWIVADNVRRIMAINSVQIAEILTKSGA